MNKILIYILVFTLASIFSSILKEGKCMGTSEEDENYFPIEVCTAGVNINEFLAEFKLEKVNEMVIKSTLAEDTRKTKTITIISNKKKIESFLTALYKVKCIDYTLCSCDNEIWLYENNNLKLKVALCIDKESSIIRFYRPEHVQDENDPLGVRDFYINNTKLCSWLYTVMDREKY